MNQEEIIDLLEKNYDILSQTNAKWLDKRVKYLLASDELITFSFVFSDKIGSVLGLLVNSLILL